MYPSLTYNGEETTDLRIFSDIELFGEQFQMLI